MLESIPTPAAERQRRHRERRRAGIFVVPVQVTCEMVEALIKRGDLDEAGARDLDCVGEAIAAAARRGLDLTSGECLLLGVERKWRGGGWNFSC